MQRKIMLSDIEERRAFKAADRAIEMRQISVSMLSMAGANQRGTKGWYVLQTYANREKIVEKMLREKGIHVFLPTLPGGKSVVRHRVVNRAGRPAIPGYVLVSIVPSPAAFVGLVRLKNIDCVVGGAANPHRVSDEDMDRFKHVLGEWDEDAAHASTFSVNDQVQFDEGPFVGFIGYIKKIRSMVPARGQKKIQVEADVAFEVEGKAHSVRTPLALLVKL